MKKKNKQKEQKNKENTLNRLQEKEVELISLFYEEKELTVKNIAQKLSVSFNIAKKLIDNLSKNYSFNIGFNKKTKKYFLVQNEIEKNYLQVNFWSYLLMKIFYILSNVQNEKIKNLAVILWFNFIKFCKEKYTLESQSFEFIDQDLISVLNENMLNYTKQMDYNLFIKIKNAISSKNELRIVIEDRINGGLKRLNLFPLHLAFLKNNWYLIAFAENEYLVFQMDDVKEVYNTGRLLEESIDLSVEDAIPELKEYIIYSKKYQVVLDITDYVKVYGIGFFHPSQRIIKEKDRILLNIEISNLTILFRWLSSLGKVVKIVEPEIVIQKYIEYLLSIIDNYN